MPSSTANYDPATRIALTDSCLVELGPRGELVRIGPRATDGSVAVVLAAPGADLWRARLANGQIAFASDFGEPSFGWDQSGQALTVSYDGTHIRVAVTFVFRDSSVGLRATISNRGREPVKYFFLPHSLSFGVDDLRQFLFPKTYGVRLSRGFFERRRRIETGYPGPMDFMYLDTGRGCIAFRGEQPIRDRTPFSPSEPCLVPARLAVRGVKHGSTVRGEVSHGHNVWVREGESFQTPLYWIDVGLSLDDALGRYRASNTVSRTLGEKLPDSYERFRRSIVVHSEVESAGEAERLAERLPRNATVHYSSYLPNGFDRYYPVHLPPRPDFGTEDDFGRAMRVTRESGRRTLLYTNYTWWCTDSPMLAEHGGKGLQLREDGAPILEYYYEQTGYTASMLAPIHRDHMLREITRLRDLGCDVVLIDQLSARPFKPPFLTEDSFWDFNDACPVPYGAPQGLADAAKAVSAIVPLSTEVWDNGPVDYLANWVSQYCGYWVEGLRVEEGLHDPMSLPFAASGYGTTLFARESGLAAGPSRTLEALERFRRAGSPLPSRDVSFYPLALKLLHETAAFTWHDLAADRSVGEERMLTLSLLLGFQLIYHAGSRGEPVRDHWKMFARRAGQDPQWPDEPTRRWLDTLALIADSFPAVGEPLRFFEEAEPDRYVAAYGEIHVLANLTDDPWEIGTGMLIAGNGFLLELVRDHTVARACALLDSNRWVWDEP